MVVLAAAVVTKTGKGKWPQHRQKNCCWRKGAGRRLLSCSAVSPRPCAALVSRQFVDMSRIRIEGLLAAFPKLVGTGKQHTYVETENVRYLYQPIEVGRAARAEVPHLAA